MHNRTDRVCEIRQAEFMPELDFDARWAAWITRGKQHDRVVRRRLLVAVPALAALVAVVWTYVLLVN